MALFPTRHAASRAAGAITTGPTALELVRTANLELIPTTKVADHFAHLRPGTPVTVTCSPVRGVDATLEVACRLLDLGHPVVPHLAARMVESSAHVARIGRWLRDHEVTEVFVIGGDAPTPAGPYADALALVRALLGTGAALERVGTGAYPDGHASIPTDVLDRSLIERQQLLDDAGVDGWLSTQMCFESDVVGDWIVRQRSRGVHLPIRLGVPGAVETTKLLTMGVKLGIGASLRYLRKNRAAVSRLVGPGGFDPLEFVVPLVERPDFETLGIEALHVFTFNQVAATEAWRRAVLAAD